MGPIRLYRNGSRRGSVAFQFMLGTVLLLALLTAADPVRLGIVVLLTSRPRPMLSLFGFCVGATTTFTACVVCLLLLLRNFGQMIAQGLMSAGASSTARHLQIAGGLLALLLATLIAVGLLARLRARVSMPVAISRRGAEAEQTDCILASVGPHSTVRRKAGVGGWGLRPAPHCHPRLMSRLLPSRHREPPLPRSSAEPSCSSS